MNTAAVSEILFLSTERVNPVTATSVIIINIADIIEIKERFSIITVRALTFINRSLTDKKRLLKVREKSNKDKRKLIRNKKKFNILI